MQEFLKRISRKVKYKINDVKTLKNLENFDIVLYELYDDKSISLDEINKVLSIKEDDFLHNFAHFKKLDFIDLKKEEIDLSLLEKMPPSFMENRDLVFFKEDDKYIYVSTYNSFNVSLLDRISSIFKDKKVKIFISSKIQISKILDEFILEKELKELFKELKFELKSKSDKEQSAVSKLFRLITYEAIKLNSSDIHFEINDKDALIRFRVDGIMFVFIKLEQDIYNALIFYIKILAHLNVAEKRKAQDGSFSMEFEGLEYDFRFSSLPIINGETIVLRILKRKAEILSLDDLKFDEVVLQKYRKSINLPHGLILLTGPTGSGKSTTLYASLNEIKSESKKIISAEDPIEYRIDLVQQILLNEKAGLDFNNALRAMLRQDPDVIMIGEIRDEQSLDIAIKASLTGHLVFSTLHTNDSISAISRMLDMKAKPYLISCSLTVVIAQRLLRKLCPYCKKISDKKYSEFDGTFFEAASCKECNYTGYLGRELVSECLFIDEELSELIRINASKAQILQKAKEKGFKTIFDNALQKARLGISSIDEIYRVLR